jgi:hypothetical protein
VAKWVRLPWCSLLACSWWAAVVSGVLSLHEFLVVT